ncbi:MAG: DUF429 domain-containing protein [Candidatus Protistobacter heckmanni]|nr:DUF429 domain-containing protein [Candidatus Protistobacter heckmanni]
MREAARRIIGVDFSSAPSRRKPIVVAGGRLDGDTLHVQGLIAFDNLQSYADWLARRGADGGWIGGFDLPFGLPRELLRALGWPLDWRASVAHYAALSREEIREIFRAFCAARPAGGKFAHRACDWPAGSSPSMKWVNPPVAFMLHAGLPPLLGAGAAFPAHGLPPARAGMPVALEAYPGWLARQIVKASYKSDARAKQNAARREARKTIVAALEAGGPLGMPLLLAQGLRERLLEDGSGDSLDAVLCVLQAAWASRQEGYGLPEGVDPLEGWIAAVPAPRA